MPWQHTHLPYNNIILDIHPCVIIGARREISPRAPMSFFSNIFAVKLLLYFPYFCHTVYVVNNV